MEELAELLLAASYEEVEKYGHASLFISITDIAASLGIEDQKRVIDASHLLEEKGCVLLAFDHATALSAALTSEGEAYVERGGETGIIGEYQRYRAQKATQSGNLPEMEFDLPDDSVPHSEPGPAFAQQPSDAPSSASPYRVAREDLRPVIASLEMLINNDASIPATLRSDLIIDLKSLELQMSRNDPRKHVIDAIALDLKKLPGLAALVDLLIAKS